MNNVALEKKKQRHLSSVKRVLLNKKIKLSYSFFKHTLNDNQFFKQSQIIASFISIKTEISTELLNSLVRNENKILCLPVISSHQKKPLIFREFSSEDELLDGKYGVKEPRNNKAVLPDIIFTPCLAYDELGFRLGYGGGYYDRTISYLKSSNHKFLCIGFAFDEQKVKNVVKDNFDQKLDYVLTEKQLYKIK